jgi:penicillin-binding protein 1B
MVRKLREMAAAISLERRLSKDAILEMYLNEIFFAQEGSIAIHGVQEAAQNFFGKDVADLSIAQGALLAGLVQAPTKYSPRHKLERAVERRNVVLGEMRDENFITETQYNAAIKEPLKVSPALLRKKNASHFVASLERELIDNYNVNTDIPVGINVYTSIDTELQRCAEKALQESVAKLEQSNPQLKKKGKPLEQALVAIDPTTGAVRAWVGGRDFGENQFDHVRQARRQIGSTIKPFLYLTSLDGSLNSYRVASPVSILSDEPTGITLFNHKEWRPENYDHKYMGDVTLRYALEHSLNIPAVYVAQRVGIPALAHTLERFHISESVPRVPALALGALDTSLFRLTSGYSALANRGIYVEPHLFDVVRDSSGSIVAQPTGTTERIAQEGPVYVVTDIMRGVINKGTATVIRKIGFQGDAAGKTGTSNETRDAWFVGFTPNLAVGIWSGYDDNKQIGLTGGVVAAPTWARFMQCAQDYIGNPGSTFTMPDSVEKVRLDKDTLCRVTDSFTPEHTFDEVFVRGTAPEQVCEGAPAPEATPDGEGSSEKGKQPTTDVSPEETTNDEGQYPGVDMGETRLPRREPSGDRELEDESQDELYQ